MSEMSEMTDELAASLSVSANAVSVLVVILWSRIALGDPSVRSASSATFLR